MKKIKCLHCGADLKYKNGDIKCEYCGSLVDTSIKDQLTDAEFINSRLMDVNETVCTDCGATLITNVNTITTKCRYCGGTVVYDEKIKKVFKPEKILLYEIDLEEAKKIVRNKVKDSEGLVQNLHQIYLPYWMYDCNVTAVDELDEKVFIECEGILLDASAKIDNILADSVENFDLSKLKDFDVDDLLENLAEEYDVTSKSVFKRFEYKTKTYLYNFSNVNIKEVTSRYILLPFYYGEFGGKVVLVNGQKGDFISESKNVCSPLENKYDINKNLTVEQVKNIIIEDIVAKFCALGIVLLIFFISFLLVGILLNVSDTIFFGALIPVIVVGSFTLIYLMLSMRQIGMVSGYVDEKNKDITRKFLSVNIPRKYHKIENILLNHNKNLTENYLFEGYVNEKIYDMDDINALIMLQNLEKLKQHEDCLKKRAKKRANKYIKRIEKID